MHFECKFVHLFEAWSWNRVEPDSGRAELILDTLLIYLVR